MFLYHLMHLTIQDEKTSLCKIQVCATPPAICSGLLADSRCVVLAAPHAGMNLFLYEKVGRRAIVPAGSTSEAGGRAQAPVPTPSPKRRESKGTSPLGECSRAEPSRSSEHAEITLQRRAFGAGRTGRRGRGRRRKGKTQRRRIPFPAGKGSLSLYRVWRGKCTPGERPPGGL